jgi:hypothetical protein
MAGDMMDRRIDPLLPHDQVCVSKPAHRSDDDRRIGKEQQYPSDDVTHIRLAPSHDHPKFDHGVSLRARRPLCDERLNIVGCCKEHTVGGVGP